MMSVTMPVWSTLDIITNKMKVTTAAFAFSIASVMANPWHSVNDFDIHGDICPANHITMECPTVCAPSEIMCPDSMRPMPCPGNSFYCGDGQCHPGPSRSFACASVRSVCACPGEDKALHVPCTPKNPFNVSTQYLANQDQSNLARDCLAKLNITQRADSSIYVKQCKPIDTVPFSWLSTLFIVFYIVAAAEVVLIAYYFSYRRTQLYKFKKSSFKSSNTYTHLPIADQGVPSPEIKFSGYQQDTFASFVKASIFLTTLGWIILMFTLIADYYQLFSMWVVEGSTGLIFDDHEHLSKIFIVFWHFSTFWFLALQVNKGSLRTMFLTRCDMNEASYVLIEKTRQAPVKFDDMGKLAEFAQQLEAWLRQYTKTNVSREIVQFQTNKTGTQFIEFECVRYIFNPKDASFQPFQLKVDGTNSNLHSLAAKGLSTYEAVLRLNLCGPNEILFKTKTFLEEAVAEFSGIFYLYQFVMLEIWYFYAYYYMGMVLTTIIIGSGITKVLVAISSQERILKLAKFTGTSKVFRDGRWIELDSSELAVGDLIEIEANESPLSVDCVIMNGDVVVDESSLTGEALPVAKFALKNNSDEFKEESTKFNRLYAGTMVLETQKEKIHEKVTALILATGGSTEKGKLVRDILYPVPFSFVFHEHLKLIFPILIVWGVFMLILSIAMLKSADIGSWFYGMFGISQVLSPLLPAVLVIGQAVSAERMRSKGIICVDLNRITLAGKVKVFCFDKTGTLTKEGLEFIGTHEVDKSTVAFKDINYDFNYFSSSMKLAMQTCHSISMVQNKAVGNFVDVEMFKHSRASIDSKSNMLIQSHLSSEPIRIIKRYEFNHSHAYMSTVCQDVVTGTAHVFVKGSFEKILSLTDPSSLPSDFAAIAKNHASQGFYVLAVATRTFEFSSSFVATATRDQFESGVKLVGLMLFRNELKPDTQKALSELREGGCRNVMITGDHANTAVFIGKSSGMISIDSFGRIPLVLMAELVDDVIVWHDVDTNETYKQKAVEEAVYSSRQGGRKVELVIAGKAFKHLSEFFWIQQFLGEVRIFARMSPIDKVHCVRLHMTHHVTAMCGDGGNDAGALKAAHAGIALSGSGSSVVSHFSSNNLSIMSCVDLLKEARCSLDISLASYKILIMYGEILAFSGLIQYYFMVQMSQALWIFIDGSTVPLSWALTCSLPAPKLSKSRPTARLLGFETILSVLGQIVINIVFLCIAVGILFNQSFFLCKEFDPKYVDLRKWWEMADNYEGAMLGVLTSFQILHSSCAFSMGSKYREGFFKNRLYLFVYVMLFTMLSAILLLDPNPVGCIFHINCGTKSALELLGYKVGFEAPKLYFSGIGHNVFPTYFRWSIWIMSVLNLIAIMTWEGIFILGPFRTWARRWANGRWQVRKRPLKV